MKLPAFALRHKMAAAVTGPVVAHHALDMAREHLFLAVHEAISHAGWIVYSVCGTLVVVPVIGWLGYRYYRGREEEKEASN